MKVKTLKHSGLQVPGVTFGCWELGGGKWVKGDDQKNIELIRKAREDGITLFDTAVNYGDGHSETILGEALKPIRDRCMIATKVRPEMLRAADVRKSVEGSLRRLQTDRIDILYVHWPNVEIPLEETMGAFMDLQREGVIRAIGVSNFSAAQLEEASRYAPIDLLQMEYSLLKRDIETEIVPLCLEKGIGITSYSTNAKGILAGRFHFGDSLPEGDFRTGRRLFKPEHIEIEKPLISLISEIAEKHSAGMAQVALYWAFHQPGMVSCIFGTQSEAHLNENIAALDVNLSEDELKRLNDMSDLVLREIDG